MFVLWLLVADQILQVLVPPPPQYRLGVLTGHLPMTIHDASCTCIYPFQRSHMIHHGTLHRVHREPPELWFCPGSTWHWGVILPAGTKSSSSPSSISDQLRKLFSLLFLFVSFFGPDEGELVYPTHHVVLETTSRNQGSELSRL